MRLETIRKSTVVRNCQNIIAEVIKENNLPEGISCLINGDYKVGEMMTNDKRVPLISATGSIRMGKIVAQTVGSFGKIIIGIRWKQCHHRYTRC
jgi:acyl-CoA reductase-like NAD-dependent aldehyde dehydrogenase